MSDTIGKNVAFYRRKKGLTQRELARETGLSVSFISHIENNISNPSDDSLNKIADILDVEINDLDCQDKFDNFKDEDNELLKLLIKLTRDLKISWQKKKDNINNFDCIYITNPPIKGTQYQLGYKTRLFNNKPVLDYIELKYINRDYNIDGTLNDYNDSPYGANLYNLLSEIKDREKDKSPIFKLINELEEIENTDGSYTDDNTWIPF